MLNENEIWLEILYLLFIRYPKKIKTEMCQINSRKVTLFPLNVKNVT